jgi:hypothetical protein
MPTTNRTIIVATVPNGGSWPPLELTVGDFSRSAGCDRAARPSVCLVLACRHDVVAHLRSRPWRIRSSTSVSVQYHCHENQRRSSGSGATTAARTPAASRSLSAWPGFGVRSAGPRIGLVPAHQLTRMQVSLVGGHLHRARDDRAAPLQRCPQRLQLVPLEPELGAQVVDAGWSRGGEMIQQPGPAARWCVLPSASGRMPGSYSGAVLIAEDGVIRVGDRTVVMENAPREVAEYVAAHRIHAWNGHNYAWELTESPGIRDSGSAVRVGWCGTTTLRTWTVCQRRSRISMVTASLMETCPDDHACRHCPS